MNQIIMNQTTNRKLRVMFFTSNLGRGGAEMHLLRLLNHLDPARFSLSVAVARSGGTYETELAPYVTLHALDATKSRSSTLQVLLARRPLQRLIRQEAPDILCAVLDLPSLVSVVACRQLRRRREYCPHLVLNVQAPPGIVYRLAPFPQGKIMLAAMRRLFPSADRVVALSQGVARDLITVSPLLQDRIEVIYNEGVDDTLLGKATEDLTEKIDRPLIVACGRLEEQKGFIYLLEAVALVRQSLPVHLWIVGEGSLRSLLEAKINQLGLGDCVRLMGFQSNPYKYMAAADVFVLSSIFEGFANVVVEAMASGAPVVSTDCPYGPGEIIESEVSGILVPPTDTKALAEAIERVLTNAELRARLIRNGSERAQDFNATTIAGDYGGLFERMVAEGMPSDSSTLKQ